MHELYELKEKLMKELAEYAQNGKFSKEDAEAIKYVSSAIDHICNIIERMEDEEYSQRGGQGRYSYESGNTGGGGSYARGGNRGGGGGNYSRNQSGGGNYYSREGRSYARGRGQNAQRDSMGRYSGSGESEQMIEQLEDLMQDAPNEQIKQGIQKLVQQIEQMM